MTPSELLERLAITLKTEIGPAVEAEYPRTQAFLSAVVLQKLAGQLRLADEHAVANAEATAELIRDLGELMNNLEADDLEVLAELKTAYERMAEDGDAGLCRFIEALYAARDTVGDTHFDRLLGRVRQTLRGTLDRRMAYAA